MTSIGRLIGEPAVDVAAEQGRTNLRHQLLRDQLETSLEAVVDLDLSPLREQLDAAGRVGRQRVLAIDYQFDVLADGRLVKRADFGEHCLDERLVLRPAPYVHVGLKQLERYNMINLKRLHLNLEDVYTKYKPSDRFNVIQAKIENLRRTWYNPWRIRVLLISEYLASLLVTSPRRLRASSSTFLT